MVPDSTLRAARLAAAGTAVLITLRDGEIHTVPIENPSSETTPTVTVLDEWPVWTRFIPISVRDAYAYPIELIKSLDRYTQSRNWIGNYREPVACELPRSLCPIRAARRTHNGMSAAQRAHRKRRHYIQHLKAR